MSRAKKKIAVIGAGPSGLIASEILSSHPDFEHVVFERDSEVGGMWRYTDETELDSGGHRVHSSLYKSLVSNSPMAFFTIVGFPMPSDIGPCEFVPHRRYLQYLQDFAEQRHLRPNIKFNTAVKLIKPLVTKGQKVKSRFPQLLIETEDVLDKTKKELIFDAVFICTSGYSDPYIPHINGMDKFRGIVMHSCQYRVPDKFIGMKVVFIGGGPSGFDILFEVSKCASSVTLFVTTFDRFCLKKQYDNGVFPANVEVLMDKVVGMDMDSITLESGQVLPADAIIFCTGYKYYFPFLHTNCGMTVTDSLVSPLYKHMINTKYPNIMFMAMMNSFQTATIACWQVPLALKILDGTLKLPTEEEMNADTEAEIADRRTYRWYRGRENHYFLAEPYTCFSYVDEIRKLGGLPKYPKSVEKLTLDSVEVIKTNLPTFRDSTQYTFDGSDMYDHHF